MHAFVPVRVATAALLALAVGFGLGCSDGSSNGPDGGAQLTLVDPSTPHAELQQGDTRQLSVRYRSVLGPPVIGARVDFIMLGNAKGSTLSEDSARTDSAGLASVELRAGSASTEFTVRVIAPAAPFLNLAITVTDFEPGTLSVRTSYDGALPTEQVDRIDLLLYESLGCSEIDVLDPTPPLRSSTVEGVGASTSFRALRVGRKHSLLGRGLDSGGWLRLGSCVDLPAGLLAGGKPVTFELVLEDLAPRAAGSYALDSELVPKTPILALTPLLAPWADLSDCELDPAQRLLDCVVDAIDDDDPLDCVIPDEGHSPLTAAILEERGALVAGCRTPLLGNASPTVDKRISDLMNANGAKLLAAIASVPQAVEDVLSRFHVISTLTIASAQFADESKRLITSAVHRLSDFVLQGETQPVTYPFGAIVAARPVTEAEVLIDNWTLSVADHGLTLRLDLIAQTALGDPVLADASLPSDARAVVDHLVALVTAPPAEPGCGAISQIICRAVGRPDDCLAAACPKGLDALAIYLDSGFLAATTQGVDLRLAGQAPLVDLDGDLVPDLIGSDPKDEDVTGVWGDIDLWMGGAEVSMHSATFQGERLPEAQQ